MQGSIIYIQEQHPNLVETFIRAEIEELYRRDYDVWVATPRVLHENLGRCGYAARVVEAPVEQLAERLSKLRPAYLHSHFVTEAARYAIPLAEQLRVPFGFTAHAYDLWLRGHRVEPELINAIGNHPLCITASVIGSRHKEYLQWCGVPEHKIVIAPNCVDPEVLLEQKASPPRGVQKIVAVGRPVAKKGFFVAIDAVRLLHLHGYRDIQLEIIGGADPGKPLGPVVAQYASHFPFVSATGLVDNKTALAKIQAADALLMPCVVAENGDSDGIPTVLPEAMMMGVPVIASNVGSIEDLVIDGETGFLSRSGDSASLAKCVVELDKLLRTPAQAHELLEKARLRAQRHSAPESVGNLISHIEQQLAGHSQVQQGV